jgi:hypothetical protein
MKRSFTILTFLCALTLMTTAAWGQGVFTAYSQNFDGSGSLPAGWTADAGTGTWSLAATSGSNIYSGASGVNNVVVTNGATLATYNLTANASISTVGYTGITVIWGARRTSTFTETVTFAWSTDGSTWNTAAYTEVTGNSTWALINAGTAISLPVGAEGAANLQFRWTITQLNNSGTYRIDDFKVQGTRALRDGDGSATLSNAFGSGVLNTSVIFPKNTAGQSVQLTLTGSSAGTLTKVSVAIPYQWGWSGNGADVSTTGDGASLTNQVVTGAGTNGNPYVITYDGGITNAAIGKITISNLTTPNITVVTDNGNFAFVVLTAVASGTLTSITSQPVAYVIIPMSNIRNQSGGVPVLNNNIVVVEGVATVASGVFSASNLQSYFQDATGGVNLFYSSTGVTITEGNDYIAKGTITQFNGNTEVVASSTTDIKDNGASTMPAYQVVTVATLNASPESYEGKYIAVQNLTRSTGVWPTSAGAAGSGVTLVFTDGTNNLNVFVDYDTDVDGNAEPSWPKDIKGIFYQSASTPTYILTPRHFAQDIATAGSLPVELTSFTATGTHSGAVLAWKTATEKNNFGFNIERRTVGSSVWSKIGFVAGHGTSNVANSYTYADAKVAAGTYAYRVAQVDNDGTVKTYNESEVTVGAAAKVLTLGNYPNPFNPTTTFEFSVPNDGMTTVKIYNVLGQEVLTAFSGEVKAGTYQHATFDGSKFSSGVYFYAIENNGQHMVKKMLMMK